MPDNLAQRLNDLLVQRDIDLLRLAAGDATRLDASIDALTSELTHRLIRLDPTIVGHNEGQRRLDEIILSSRTVIRQHYQAEYRDLRRQLIDVMISESNHLTQSLASSMSISDSLAGRILGGEVGRSVIREIIDERVMTVNANDAERLRGFFEREAASHHRKASGALRQAFSQDETITQMITRLREVTRIVARESESIIRTGYNHAVSQMRMEMMQRNSHLFRGVIAIAILDSRTTFVCISRSRGMWNVNNGQPLSESPIQIRFPGPPPWHHNCRTQLYPLTRRADEVATRGGDDVRSAIDQLTDDQRALLSVDPPDDETYTQWLGRQSASVQNQVLGPNRRKLWLDGKISLADLVNQKGRPLTLKQLDRKIRRKAS